MLIKKEPDDLTRRDSGTSSPRQPAASTDREGCAHTTLPWMAMGATVSRDIPGFGQLVPIAICRARSGGGPVTIPIAMRNANAEFIVRACNSHADLLAALEEMVACCTDSHGAISPEPADRGRWLRAMLDARSVLAKAEAREAK